MNTKDIKIGTGLQLKVLNDYFNGRVVDGTFEKINGGQVVISTGFDKYDLMEVSVRTKVIIYFDDYSYGALSFEGAVIYKEELISPTRLHIKIESDIKQIQRREYFRPDCLLKSEYKTINNTNLMKGDNNYITAQSKNVSYSGACIISKEDVPKDTLIDLIIWLSSKISINMICKVVRSMEIVNEKQYELGLIIEDIKQKDRDILVKYITRNTMVQSLYLGESEFEI